MEKLTKYKETIIFVSCATALVGMVLVLQNVTTPSQHKRHTGSSASRGGPRSRSASHGPAGARSRSSSRLRSSHANDRETGGLLTASANPVMSAGAGDRVHASRSRDASQAHSHRHHAAPHQRSPETAGADTHHVKSDTTAATGATVNAVKMTAAAAVSAKMLTVEAVAQHTKALGTANALQRPSHASSGAADMPVEPYRDVRTTGGRTVGSGVEELGNYRSVSNAATVGSQALYGGSTTSPTVGSAVTGTTTGAAVAAASAATAPPLFSTRASDSTKGESAGGGLSLRSPRASEPAPLPASASQVPVQPSRSVSPTSAQAAETQTNHRWFCNDHSTQTELMGDARLDYLSCVTPDRKACAATLHSPILSSGDGNDSPGLNCADFVWTPMPEADTTKPMNTTGAARGCVKGEASTTVPNYFLTKLESQIQLLIRRIMDDDRTSEKSWMELYVYLSELPLSVRQTLAARDRCGVTSSLIDLAITVIPVMTTHASTVAEEQSDKENGNVLPRLVEEAAVAVAETVAASPTASLPQEVLHLLQHGTPLQTKVHFEWRGDRCICAPGEFVACAEALSQPPIAAEAVGHGRSTRFAHVQLSPSSSPTLSTTGEDGLCETDDDEEGPFCVLVAVAKHIERYSSRLSRRAAPPHSDEVTAAAVDEHTPTRQKHDDTPGAPPLLQQFQSRQQQQLASFLAAFSQLRYTDSFQALRRSPQFAPFACDFIELASSAQHCLDSSALSLSGSAVLVQAPTAQKRQMSSETTDAHDTSIGTTTSARSDSSPTATAAAAGAAADRTRRSVKSRTPMKPSIRYPIQHVLSNSPHPVGNAKRPATAAVTGEPPNAFERLYTPPQRNW